MKEFMSLEELSQLIIVRNHLFDLLNGTRNAVKKGEVGSISALVQRLDIQIVHNSLELFKDEVVVEEELDIAKKIAEAKAKMAQKTKIAPTEDVSPIESVNQTQVTTELASAPKLPKRTFKRVNKDGPNTI